MRRRRLSSVFVISGMISGTNYGQDVAAGSLPVTPGNRPSGSRVPPHPAAPATHPVNISVNTVFTTFPRRFIISPLLSVKRRSELKKQTGSSTGLLYDQNMIRSHVVIRTIFSS